MASMACINGAGAGAGLERNKTFESPEDEVRSSEVYGTTRDMAWHFDPPGRCALLFVSQLDQHDWHCSILRDTVNPHKSYQGWVCCYEKTESGNLGYSTTSALDPLTRRAGA